MSSIHAEYGKIIVIPFTIMSDKQTYNVGDHITFTGVINEAKDDITQGQVVITMTDPGGNKLTTASAKSGEDLVTKTVEYSLSDIQMRLENTSQMVI